MGWCERKEYKDGPGLGHTKAISWKILVSHLVGTQLVGTYPLPSQAHQQEPRSVVHSCWEFIWHSNMAAGIASEGFIHHTMPTPLPTNFRQPSVPQIYLRHGPQEYLDQFLCVSTHLSMCQIIRNSKGILHYRHNQYHVQTCNTHHSFHPTKSHTQHGQSLTTNQLMWPMGHTFPSSAVDGFLQVLVQLLNFTKMLFPQVSPCNHPTRTEKWERENAGYYFARRMDFASSPSARSPSFCQSLCLLIQAPRGHWLTLAQE